MALISCSECKKEVSDTVKRCPHCGFVMRRIQWNWWMIGSYAISIFAIIFVLVDVHAVVDLTTDTFIGIVASLIGAAATIIVGAQIYNSIEAKRLMNDIRDRQSRLDQSINGVSEQINSIKSESIEFYGKLSDFQDKMDMTNSKINTALPDLYSMSYFVSGLVGINECPYTSYHCFVQALEYNLSSSNEIVRSNTLSNLECVLIKLENKFYYNNIVIPIDYDVDIVDDNGSSVIDKVKSHSNYGLVKDSFEKLEKLRLDLTKRIEERNEKIEQEEI